MLRVDAIPGRLRWRRVVWSARLRARLTGRSLRVSTAPGVRAGRGVRIEVRGSRCELDVGQGSRLHDAALIDLAGDGCRVRLGAKVELRSRVVLRIAEGASLELCGRNMLSYGTVVHVAERIRIGERTSMAEYVSIIDSNHRPPDGDRNFRDTLETAAVEIGSDVWIGAKATVGAGVSVGDRAVIAGSAVVVRDVAPGTVVAGVPARPLELDAGTSPPEP